MIKNKRESKPYIKNKKHFIDDTIFYEEMVKWKAQLEIDKDTKMPNSIAKIVMMAIQHYARSPKWRYYTYIEEMKSEALYNALRYLKNFDTIKYQKPFAYLTSIMYSSFLQVLLMEKKNSKKKKELLDIMFHGSGIDPTNKNRNEINEIHIKTVDHGFAPLKIYKKGEKKSKTFKTEQEYKDWVETSK
jgi:hypothetical protein